MDKRVILSNSFLPEWIIGISFTVIRLLFAPLLLLAASQTCVAGLSFQAIRILRACRIPQSADRSVMCLGGVVLWTIKR